MDTAQRGFEAVANRIRSVLTTYSGQLPSGAVTLLEEARNRAENERARLAQGPMLVWITPQGDGRVGVSRLEDGELLTIKIERAGTEARVSIEGNTIRRLNVFTANGGRIPLEGQPPPNPGGDPGGGSGTPTAIANYSAWNAAITTHPDGFLVERNADNPAQDYFSVVSNASHLVDSAVNRKYIGTAIVKAGGQGQTKPMALVIREKTAGGTEVGRKEQPFNATTSFQTITVDYTTAAAGNKMDLYVVMRTAVIGDEYILQAAPSHSTQDAAPPTPTPLVGWFSYAGTQAKVGAEVTVTADGTENYWTLNTDVGKVADSKVNRQYTANCRLKGTASTAGRQARLVIRERLADGTVRETQNTLTLTTSYQTVQTVHTCVEDNRPVDVRISVTPAVAGDQFLVETEPSISFTDPTPGGSPPPEVPAGATAFDYSFDPLALIRQKVDALAVHANSVANVNAFNQVLANGGYRINTFNNGESPPVYLGTTSHQLYTVSVGGYSQQWRLPSNAVNGGGADRPLVIRMESHPVHGQQAEIRIWQATINHTSRTVTGTNYGVFRYNSDGAKLDGGRRSVGRSIDNDGARGAGNGLTYTGGMIRRQEVIDGNILHVLRFAFGPGGQTSNHNVTSSFVAPAIKSDQSGTISGAVPMGRRFRLKASVDPNTRTVPGKADTSPETRFLRMVCRALKTYGMMPSDGSGGTHGVYMENNATGGWSTIIGEAKSGHYGWILRDNRANDGVSRNSTSGVPWTELETVVDIAENLT